MAVGGEAMRGIGRTETSFAHIPFPAGGVRHRVKRGTSARVRIPDRCEGAERRKHGSNARSTAQKERRRNMFDTS